MSLKVIVFLSSLAAVSLGTVATSLADADGGCQNDPDKKDARNCPHVVCDGKGFAQCAMEWCCMWEVEDGTITPYEGDASSR